MTDSRSVVVVGASGLVGGFCLEALVADPAFGQITVVTRRELALAAGSRVKQSIVDFDQLSPEHFAGVDDVFCALGTTIGKAGSQEAFRRVDLEIPLQAARAARQAGARQFLLVSSVGADARSGNFYLCTKGDLEEKLGEIGFDALHIFRPSLLLGKREEFRIGERIMVPLAPVLNMFLLGGFRRFRAIPAATVGKAMPAAAKRQTRGAHVYHYDEIARLASSLTVR